MSIGVLSETPLVGGGNADSISEGPSFSFGKNTSDAALEMMNGGTPTAEADVEQAEVPQESATLTQKVENPAASAEATNVDNASAAQLAQLSDDQLVEVTVDGEVVQMPWKDAKSGVMRQAHYTRQMQALRKEQSEFEANRQALETARQEREALVQLLNNEEMVRKFLQAKYPNILTPQQQEAVAQAAAQGQIDPDDIATVGQVQQFAKSYAEAVAKQVEELKQGLQQEVNRVTQTIEDRQATAKLSSEISGTIDELFKSAPHVAKVIPNAEQVLRYEVYQLQPTTPQETIEAFKTVFGGWVEQFNSAVQETTKQSVVNKQKLVQNNLPPAGGAAPNPQPSNFKSKDGKLDWNAMREAALNMMK